MGESGADDADDEGAYPPAPLPAHERRWRHPSEVGAAEWVVTEPPIALGRGLMITTGAIGCVLGLAILWLLVPTNGDAPIAGTTELVRARASAVEPAATATDDLRATLPVGVVSTVAQLPATSAAVAQASTFLLPAEDVTANTVRLPDLQGTTVTAIAVVVEHLGVMVTTATAVEVGMRLEALPASGEPMEVEVVGVDGPFAYLTAAAPPEDGFATWDEPVAGGTLTILGERTVSYTYGDTVPADVVAAAGVAEGTPVVDVDGDLVGLCTLAAGDLEVLPISSVEGLAGEAPPTSAAATSTTSTSAPATSVAPTTAPPVATTTPAGAPATSSSPTTSPQVSTTLAPTSSAGATTTTSTSTTAAAPQAWMGVRLGGVEGSHPLAVTAVDTASPAQQAGIAIGDQIVAVDGSSVTSADQVTAIVRARRPGDPLSITLVPATPAGGGTSTTARPVQRTVSVVLGTRGSTV